MFNKLSKMNKLYFIYTYLTASLMIWIFYFFLAINNISLFWLFDTIISFLSWLLMGAALTYSYSLLRFLSHKHRERIAIFCFLIFLLFCIYKEIMPTQNDIYVKVFNGIREFFMLMNAVYFGSLLLKVFKVNYMHNRNKMSKIWD